MLYHRLLLNYFNLRYFQYFWYFWCCCLFLKLIWKGAFSFYLVFLIFWIHKTIKFLKGIIIFINFIKNYFLWWSFLVLLHIILTHDFLWLLWCLWVNKFVFRGLDMRHFSFRAWKCWRFVHLIMGITWYVLDLLVLWLLIRFSL